MHGTMLMAMETTGTGATSQGSGPRRAPAVGTTPDAAQGVHLVGSIPVANAEEAFRTVAGSLGDWLWRLPDGETGPRGDWIVWQYPLFSSRPEFEICPPRGQQYR